MDSKTNWEQKHVGAMLRYCSQLCRERMDGNLQRYGLTQAQAHTILFLNFAAQEGEVNQKAVEKEFGIKGSTVNGIVERLEEKGFVSRAAGSRDGRCRRLLLTEKSRQLVREMDGSIVETEALMLHGFSEKEKEQLLQYLDRITKNLKESEAIV